MRSPVALENIAALRLKEGIVDHVLRHAIKRLKVGDFVKLTFLFGVGAATGETLSVRIIGVAPGVYRGELVERPASAALSEIKVGTSIEFAEVHVHSLAPAKDRT
jgi:hypothetical protein